MLKRFSALIISLLILSVSLVVSAAEGYDGGNTNADNTIVDTVNWLDSDVYDIDDKFVTVVSPGITVDTFIKNFKNYESKVTVADCNITDIIKTGMVVKHSGSGESLIVVVKGDIDKNGIVNATDIVSLSSHISGTSKIKIETAEFEAADYDSNGKATIVDLVNIKKYIMGE